MKKIFISLLAIIFALTLSITASATGNAYSINEVTIVFSEDSVFSAEEQVVIAEMIVNGTDNSSVTTYNLMCTLFGHKTVTESYTVIEHCVSDTAPRCLETILDLTMCTRCETLLDTHVITSYYINCCD